METHKSQLVSEEKIDFIIDKYRGKPGELLGTLEETQEAHPFKYLPAETLSEVALKLNIPMSQVYSVATFYAYFNLKPQGKNSIVVCRGTACHTKGSKALFDEVARRLGIHMKDEEADTSYTTPDNEFTVKTVACFGQCAQSPVVAVNGTIYSHVDIQQLLKIIRKVQQPKNQAK